MKDRTLLTPLLKLTLILLLLLTSCATPTAPPITPSPPTQAVTQIATTVAPPKPVVTTPPSTEAPIPTTIPPTTIPPTTPPATSVTGLTCVQDEEGINLTHSGQLTAGPFFINDQVILTGPAGSVEQAAQQLVDSMTPLVGCTFSMPEDFVGILQNEKKYPLPASDEVLPLSPSLPKVKPAAQMEMNLYRLEGSITLKEILEKIKGFPDVSADPNYLVGSLAKSACGEPGGVAGKPFDVEGSPFDVEGSPYGGAVISATLQAFWDQWAFKHLDITNRVVSSPEKAGDGARIAIFDTSPYQLETERTTAPVTEPAISPPLAMTVHHPWELFAILPSSNLTNTVDVSGHGLFVASLAHASAPASKIDLYRVLDQHGCGDLFHLNSAMLDFIISKLGEGDLKEALQKPAVMNLSLGVLKPRQISEDIENKKIDEAVAKAREIVRNQGNSIASLAFVTDLAYQAGIVVVAAAGNDSVPDLDPFTMELPAAYSYVIGVSASTVDGNRACYSNMGDVIAPGAQTGEGIYSVSGERICMPLTEDCPDIDATATPGSCEYGVVGLFKPLGSININFAYWVGTSFATPLISGKAAVQYANGSDIHQVYLDLVGDFPYHP